MSETDGVEIPINYGHVRVSVIQITGDNLGLHSLFGLVESQCHVLLQVFFS